MQTEWKENSVLVGVIMDIKEEGDGYTVEYGWSPNVRFLELKRVHMYDSKRNIVYCKCGKEALMALIGTKGQMALCSECSQTI